MAKVGKGERRIYNNPDDCGRVGRNVEVDARIEISPRTKVLHCQSYNRVDHRVKINGIWYNLEDKIHCGSVTVNYLYNIFEGIDLNDYATLAQYILPKADFVAYGYDVDESTYDVNDDLFVFTREEFIDFLFGYEKPMLKVNRKDGGYCLNIQTYKTSKNVSPMLRKLVLINLVTVSLEKKTVDNATMGKG